MRTGVREYNDIQWNLTWTYIHYSEVLSYQVAPPTPVGAWSMALGLRQRFEYYYYYC